MVYFFFLCKYYFKRFKCFRFQMIRRKSVFCQIGENFQTVVLYVEWVSKSVHEQY